LDYFIKTSGVFLFFFGFVFPSFLCAQPVRSINDIFPNLTQSEKNGVFNNGGLKHSFQKDDSTLLAPAANSGIDIISIVMKKAPSYLVDVLLVLPYNERELGILDAYNAANRIKDIKNYLYFSGAQNSGSVIFKETTRLKSATKKIPFPILRFQPYSLLRKRFTCVFTIRISVLCISGGTYPQTSTA